jgi:HSP20 family protein
MELVRWRPRRYVPAVSSDIDRVFDGLMRGWVNPGSLSEGSWNPSIDVSERDGEIVVSAEVPGIDPKDIEISVEDNRLIISGEKRQEAEENGKNYYRVERVYGSFKRSFALPSSADVENVKASSKDGVLSVSIPKRQDEESKKVEIEIQ